MKGIILAGGNGTRLHPLTHAVCKQLLPVYNKPMIYYPLSTLMLAGIREVAIITRPEDRALFEKLLKDGSQWKLKFEFIEQPRPAGIAEALILAEKFLAGQSCALILGDNIIYRDAFQALLADAKKEIEKSGGAQVFAYHVADPTQYGVVELDEHGNALSLEEKPKAPKSNYAVVGLYFFDGTASEKAKRIKPSGRGELEITDVNKEYLSEKRLRVRKLGRGTAWMDMGTPDALLEAAKFVQILEQRQGLQIADPNEISKLMST